MINQQPNATEITRNKSPNFWKFNNVSPNGVFGNKAYGSGSNNIKESLFLKHGLISRTYSKKSLIMASIFGSKSKSFMTMSIPPQDEPSIIRPVAISLPLVVPSTSDRRLIELKNQVQRLMEAHLAPKQLVQVNKITSSCEICSGPHDTQCCMENSEQAFVEYASSRNNEVGESLPVYDTDIEDVIEEEEEFIGKGGFDGEEDNIEDVVVVASDLCSSMIQTILSVDY
ncbi:hypothetical protein Tco_0210520 [Tanacetum coccineum]